jgi:hypothetical protein
MKDPTPEHCLLAAQKGANLDDIPEHLRTYEICLAAMKQQKSHHESLQFVPEQHKTPELCLAAVTTNSKSLEHVPAAFREKIKQTLDDKKTKKKDDDFPDDIPF